MAAASSRWWARSRKPDAGHSSSPTSPRRGARAPSRRTRRSTCSTASCPAPRQPTCRPILRPVIGSCAEWDEWSAFRAASGWRGGAALHLDTGMNRLGFPLERRPPSSRRRVGNDPGIALVMSHFACSEEDHPLNAIQIERFRGDARAVSRHRGIALEFLRHLPRRGRASRPGPPRRRALRRQSDARESRTRCARSSRSKAASCRSRDRRAGRDRRLQRDLDGEAPDPARHRVGRLCGRLPARRKRERHAAGRGGDRRGAALSPRRPRLDGPDRHRRDRSCRASRDARRPRRPCWATGSASTISRRAPAPSATRC